MEMAGKKERGFFLLELLVAISLLLVVIVPMLNLLTMATETQTRARRHTAATLFARETMETVRSLGYPWAKRMMVARKEEELAGRRGEFSWAVKVSAAVKPESTTPVKRKPTEPAEPQEPVSLKKIVVTVSWQERERPQKVELVTYLASERVK